MTRNDIDIRAFDRATLLGQAVAGATGALLAGTLAGCGQASTGRGPPRPLHKPPPRAATARS